MASLVVSDMSVHARPSAPPGQPPDESDAMAHYREEATPPGGRGEPRPAASKQPVTAARSTAGRNGFCRLEIAPSLVAMVRKSGVVSASEEIGRPEMTIIGICGRCWRTIRMV